ncbi:MAG TPA: hypothetical protein VKV17_06590 [Bryobacteraceae bacterium]|nr:hypothetical protein [Bryobacteraceae bacterium]
MILEPRAPEDTYFASFRPLHLRNEDVANYAAPDPARSKLVEPLAYPPPQQIALGDTVAVELMSDPNRGERIVGYLHLQNPLPVQDWKAEIAHLSNAELDQRYQQTEAALRALAATGLQAMNEQHANPPAANGVQSAPTFGQPPPAPGALLFRRLRPARTRAAA